VGIRALTGLARASGRELTAYNALTRAEHPLGSFDSVVFAAGGVAHDSVYRQLSSEGTDGTVRADGDCFAARRIAHAIMDVYRAGLTI
jgi:hypothetical protein